MIFFIVGLQEEIQTDNPSFKKKDIFDNSKLKEGKPEQ